MNGRELAEEQARAQCRHLHEEAHVGDVDAAKKTPRAENLSQAQLAMLRSAAGGDSHAHLKGRSQHGGSGGTFWSLVRRGLLTKEGKLTPEGRAALRGRGAPS